MNKIAVSFNEAISSGTRPVSACFYCYYYYYSFGSSKDLSCCIHTLPRKFRIILAESHNHAVSTIRRFRNSALKIDPQFGFFGGERVWVWTTTASFLILAGPWFTTATLTIHSACSITGCACICVQ
jgi:hypothetical protein